MEYPFVLPTDDGLVVVDCSPSLHSAAWQDLGPEMVHVALGDHGQS